jgi:rare lipoprotein A
VLFGAVSVAACTHSVEECSSADAAQHYAQSLPVATKARDVRPDLSGCKRIGVASFYADMFSGREMADGTRMNPNADNAASRTLPLGTTAKVTNLETGQSAEVTIQDRGPYVKGRIIDLSPCNCARDRARSKARPRQGRGGADRGTATRRRREAWRRSRR